MKTRIHISFSFLLRTNCSVMTLESWSYFIPNKLLLAVFSCPDCESSLFLTELFLTRSFYCCKEPQYNTSPLKKDDKLVLTKVMWWCSLFQAFPHPLLNFTLMATRLAKSMLKVCLDSLTWQSKKSFFSFHIKYRLKMLLPHTHK